MKAKMSMTGADTLMAQLRNAAVKVPENARKTMNRESVKIMELAKKMAPEDDAELTDSIHLEKMYESRGRLVINIVAGGTVRGVDVDRYAMLIHENYEGMVPGEITILKRQIYPDVYVGGKFIERAVEQSKPKLEKALIVSVTNDMEMLIG
jgi:hypothetical protein